MSLTKKEALIKILTVENIVLCKETNQLISYSNFCGGFYVIGGASDDGDSSLDIRTLPTDGSYLVIHD